MLEVKGDFCHHVRRMLAAQGREADYVEVGLDEPWRYNPLHNHLDAYALAYGVACLINNSFGRGKEPFWQLVGLIPTEVSAFAWTHSLAKTSPGLRGVRRSLDLMRSLR